MSKILYARFRDSSNLSPDLEEKLKIIADRITPDNIQAKPADISIQGNIAFCVSNPADSIQKGGQSVLLGMAYGSNERWDQPGGAIPEGSFSIFRSGIDTTEVITDAAASRSIWYYHDSDVFLASSSQRAIIMLLGDFHHNKEVLPWMLSTGTLGPNFSWDKRIRLLPPASKVELDHHTWELTTECGPVNFVPQQAADSEHEKWLTEGIASIFENLKVDFSKWVLPLSGGYDSRGILIFFNRIKVPLKQIRSITWGLQKLLTKAGNDAFIATKLADHYRIKHKYYSTDLSREPLEDIFNRFLVCGEGRIDHISGYMDGFQIWKTLYEDEIQGIIRGDEGFGWVPVDTPSDVRSRVGIGLCSDFLNLKDFHELNLSKQEMPEELKQRPDETLAGWRDRLYHQFRMPVVLAALSDLKLAYVEVINPLLAGKVLNLVRTIPDHLRTNKVLFKRIVNTLGPEIEYASSGANAKPGFFLKSQAAVDLFKSELESKHAKEILTETFTRYLIQNLIVSESGESSKLKLKALLKRYLPTWLTRKAGKVMTGKNMDVNVLAFRAYTICRMSRMMSVDSQIFSNQGVIGNGHRV
jgi:hypothetical protein